jgi:hypothetical protein
MLEIGNEVIVNIASVGQAPILRQGTIVSEPFGAGGWGIRTHDGLAGCYYEHRFLLIDADWEFG